jgi:D-Tyr-tRNAtyr deacylase
MPTPREPDGLGGTQPRPVRSPSRWSPRFAEALQRLGAEVQTGVFGVNMQVELVNGGPVTVFLDL